MVPAPSRQLRQMYPVFYSVGHHRGTDPKETKDSAWNKISFGNHILGFTGALCCVVGHETVCGVLLYVGRPLCIRIVLSEFLGVAFSFPPPQNRRRGSLCISPLIHFHQVKRLKLQKYVLDLTILILHLERFSLASELEIKTSHDKGTASRSYSHLCT